MLFDFFCYVFFVYGISNMLVFSEGPMHIFDHYRNFMHKLPSNFGEGSECMICTPMQVGIMISVIDAFLLTDLNFTPCYSTSNSTDMWYIKMLIDGSIGSGASWFIHTIQEYFENDGE